MPSWEPRKFEFMLLSYFFCSDECLTFKLFSLFRVAAGPIFSINFVRGGQLTFSAGSISAPTCKAIANELYNSKLWKQYKLNTQSGAQKEPRLHFLASHDPDTGYQYSRLKMKAEPISRLPHTQKLEHELSQQYQTTFPVGVDCLLFRDGNDYIGKIPWTCPSFALR